MKTKARFLRSILTCAMALAGLASGLGQQPPAAIQFSLPAYDGAEDAGTVAITVLRTGETNSVVTVDYATSDDKAKAGADYAAQSGTLRFASGETNKTFTISILDDGLVEGDETLNVALSKPTGGATLGSQKTALLTIRDNELRARLVDISFNPDVSGTSSSSIALQKDGKILWSGSFYSGANTISATIIRLNPDGSRDSQFGFTNEPLGQFVYDTLVLAPMPDGKILIGGAFRNVGTVSRRGIARLNENGSLDPTFDPGLGVAGVLNQDPNPRVESIAIQPDGKAVIGGVFSRFNGVARSGLARLNADGSLDTNFNASVDVSPGAITPTPDGKVFVVGGFTTVNDVRMPNIARLNADGTLDTGFRSKFTNGGSIVSAAVQTDGRVIIGGGFTTNGSTFSPLARLNSDGTTDTNFVTGPINNQYGTAGVVFTVGLQTDGKIVISGSFSSVGAIARANFARLLPDGSVDVSFDLPVDNFPSRVLVQPDDDILVAGNYSVLEGVSRVGGLARVHGDLSRAHPIEFVNAQHSVSEGTKEAGISVERAGDTTSAASVDYATSDGTAIGGVDYIAQSGRLTFAPLEVTKIINVPILVDAFVEDTKTVQLRLSNPSSGAQLGEKTIATITIHDDDKAPQFVAESLFVNENDGVAGVTLRRSGDLRQSVTLDYSTSDGTGTAGKDYTSQTGVIAFAPGAAAQTIKIPILDNGSVDEPRTVNVTVSNPAIFPKPSTATLTIRDNERQVLFDPSFDSNQEAFGAGNYPCLQALVLQADGKVVIGGCFTNVGGLSRNGIARLNRDGSLDLSFDPGSGISGISSSGVGTTVYALALQLDGKMILGGSFFRVNGRTHPVLARLYPDGTVDEEFNAEVGALGGGYPDARQVIVQSDGKILFAGYSPDGLGVARLNADGSLDATFRSVPALPPSTQVYAIALQTDGKILASGITYSSEGGRPYLIRLRADGSLDTTFKSVPPALLGVNSSISALALQLDGKILASGSFNQSDGSSRNVIFRLKPDGSPDSTFNAGLNQNIYARQILVLAAGKVLAVGYGGGVRLNSDGSLDRSFGLVDVYALAIQPDGLMIAAGSFAGGVARIFPEFNQPGGPEFAVSTFSVPETMDTAVLTVERLGNTSQEMTVDFATSDITARAGLDYVAQQGTVRFGPLQQTNTISIAIINDGMVEAEKSFEVTLSNPSSGSALQLLRTATVVITSNDTGIQFASDTFTVNEADGFAEVLVTRNGEGLSAAAVDYFTSDGTAKAGADFLARSGTITFAFGETNQTIQIPILDDGRVEGNETIQLALTNPKAGAMLGSRTNATLVIIDNEIPTLVDPSFDPGKGATDDSGNPAEVNAVAVLPDGKIVVGGFFSRFNGVARSTLARLNPDGTVDAGFRARLPGEMSQMLVQPDGKVLFFYYLNTGSLVPNLSRLGADGTPDATFRSTRFESTPQVGSSYAVVLQPDGKILIGGRFDRVGGVAQRNLARLNADGTLDPTFKVDTGPFTRWNGNVPTIVLQPDGKILISGYFSSINGTPVNGSARLNSDGSLDATFSLSDYPGTSLFLAAQPDGKILVQQDGIARVNPDGSKDASFNSRNSNVLYAQSGGYPLALQADGKILFIGTVRENDWLSRAGLFRLNPDGSLDTTLPLAIPYDNNVVSTAFAIRPDGKILFAGHFVSVNGVPRAGMVRLFGDLSGPPDISFATASSSASESAGLAVITIQRLGDTSQPASVQYTTQDSTALANLNYLPTSGTLDFAPLENEKTVVVPILDDGLPSADTGLSLILSNPSNGTIINAGVNTTTLTIADSQRPGSVDSTFDPLIETTNSPPSGFHIALQPDGKVVVAGDFQRVNGVSRNGICRLNPDGSLDVSFDPKGGLATLPDGFGNLSPVYSLALQSDGKILVRGSFNSVNGLNYTNFVRLNADGSVDTHFVADAAGQARSFYDRGGAMAVQSDGKILVAEGGSCCGMKPVGIGRLAADGSSDPTFVTLEVVGASSGWGSTFNVIIVEANGGTLFEGSADLEAPNDSGPQKGMTRLNADGSIDASFHPMMDKLIDGDLGSRAAAVVQADGKILIAGLFNQVNGVDRPGLARLNPDGSTDPSFVPENRVTENNDAGSYNIRALALQADGKILAASGDGSLVRLNADGSRDLTFDVGVDRFKQNGFANSVSDIVVQPDGQILFAGNFTSANGSARSGLVRLNGDAGLANSRARFRSITGAATGKVQLNLDVVPNRTYAIEASTDLINWTAITTRTATNYLLNVTDSASDISRRFYRIIQTAP